MVLSQLSGDPQKIASLNDAFRTTFLGGSICVSAAVYELGAPFVKDALCAVRDFVSFTPDNDPHGEHDFGEIKLAGRELLWKIDYFDDRMINAAENPADVETTRRVLTVMLQEEY